MKKVILAAILLAGATSANAESYNRITLSYDRQNFSANSDYTGTYWGWDHPLNGFGINYFHGFGVAENMFVEVGANMNFGFGSQILYSPEQYAGEWFRQKLQSHNINLTVPINYVYRINVSDNIKIAPYAGINVKANILGEYRFTYDASIDKDHFKAPGIVYEPWVNVYSSSEDDMGDDVNTWNRFQIGWQVGVGLELDKFYLGIQSGTDFIAAYKHTFEYEGYSVQPKVNSQALKVSLGYTF